MATNLPVVPRSGVADNKIADWFELSPKVVRLEDITSTFSTGEYILANLNPNIVLLGIGYRCTVPFENDSGEPSFPKFLFGDTTTVNLFGVLTQVQLGSTNSFGMMPVHYETTGSDGVSLAVDIGYGTNVGATPAGTLELWAHYRVNADRPALGGVRAK